MQHKVCNSKFAVQNMKHNNCNTKKIKLYIYRPKYATQNIPNKIGSVKHSKLVQHKNFFKNVERKM